MFKGEKMKKTIILSMVILSNNIWAYDFESADKLINRHEIKIERPKSCPLESKKLADFLVKLEAIKTTFKDNCTQKNNDKLDDILKSFKDMEEELKKRDLIQQSLEESINESVSGDQNKSEINGVAFTTLFSNINSMIKKKQCSLEDGRVLQSTADLIYDATQFGLLSGSNTGVIVAGGGFLISSSLKLIDLIMRQRFDFEKVVDRQTFIKLNCSFYDIRNSLEAEGVFDVENSNSKDDLRLANLLIEEIQVEAKKIDTDISNQKDHFASLDNGMIKSKIGDIQNIKKSLNKLKESLTINKYDNFPEETKKMLLISEIMKDYDFLILNIYSYKELKLSSIPMLDDVFIQELQKFNPIDINQVSELLKTPAATFNSTIKPNLLFHAVRILIDIETKESNVIEKNSESKKIYLANLEKNKTELNNRLVKLQTIKSKLDKIVVSKAYSALDDGSDNLVAILEDHKAISALIYGEWGEKFLKYATIKSADEIKSFNERFDRFRNKYLTGEALVSVEKKAVTYMSQDAQKLKTGFKYADSLVQEGYDFVVTNKDLFYGDVRNYYNQEIKDEDNNNFMGSIEKIKRHYVSTVLALKVIKNEPIVKEDEEKYLSKSFGGNQFIGKSMIDNEKARKDIRLIQNKFDSFNCYKIMKEDLN